jgi:hypothetical protein
MKEDVGLIVARKSRRNSSGSDMRRLFRMAKRTGSFPLAAWPGRIETVSFLTGAKESTTILLDAA